MYNKIGKRTVDIIIATTALVLLAVPMIIIASWVKFDSRGPVLFKQLRYGKNLVPFRVYKFRTMTVDAPSDMPTSAFKNAGAHITRSGKIMRKLSLDEFPQFFNVIVGDMSVVGPRPVVMREMNLIDLREQVGANSVRPGITGWAQVNGRDELNDAIKSRMDGEYVRNLSFRMDVKCFLLTVLAVVSVKGNKEGYELEGIMPVEALLDTQMVTDEV